MLKTLVNVFLAIGFWIGFVWVILNIDYPETLTEANVIQLSAFFIPLFLALALSINLLLQKIISSIIIAAALIFILVIKSLNEINIFSVGLTIAAVVLLLSYFGFGNLSKIKSFRLKKFRRKKTF